MHRFKSLSALLHLAVTILMVGLYLNNFAALSDAKIAAPLKEKSETLNMRIVSIGGTITEILYALGSGSEIVAVDSTSRYPKEALTKPNIGYMRRLSAEPILSLDPTKVLAIEDSGPLVVLDQVRDAGQDINLISDKPSLEGVYAKIQEISSAINKQGAGEKLVDELRAGLKPITDTIAKADTRPRVLLLLSFGRGGSPVAAGKNTSADSIISIVGAQNTIEDFEGYKPLSPEVAVTASPDFIITTNRSLGMIGGIDKLIEIPGLSITPAAKNKNIIVMDGLLLLGFGLRIDEALKELGSQLYPELKF